MEKKRENKCKGFSSFKVDLRYSQPSPSYRIM